ncbi:MAG TPA: ABC transporter ATP-binding protein [Chitinivibrionales bacterium]|nr:ABC transporter ATP-binding protein [Chitinivibrionales bacterium]
MSIITITGLTKVYDEKSVPVHALNGIDLTFEEGEFTTIVGPSGSGKTTLLNILGGLDTPSGGTINIAGTDMRAMSSRDLTRFRLHNIGFVFQSYNLIPVLTAQENIEFVMLLQGKGKAERAARARTLLAQVGIPDRGASRPGQLSGGQQQRVAVARALASRPRFVLADEPTANLDSKAAENLLDIMVTLNKGERVTFIFSTHDVRVMRKARRIITLEDGKVLKDETV